MIKYALKLYNEVGGYGPEMVDHTTLPNPEDREVFYRVDEVDPEFKRLRDRIAELEGQVESFKPKVNLTYRQREQLIKIFKNQFADAAWMFGSCTNATMKALKKYGFVDDEWTAPAPGELYRGHRWVITDTGKKFAESLLVL